ncbi:hypothetical protein F1728_04355 [Gimesia benthica]|uniref:Uncharacterized protein n=1 Tax=Gimesia benthica TaxID=2608982 RepID=A0A6I6A7L5_9PLAN|nr:hypothetical protein [Gimesia benthica]QGQ21968.1 hypothetical protein F1728_04355 [Gimesia benthica]
MDGYGIGRKMTGAALGNRLTALADEANKHPPEVQSQWKGMLDHARQVREALIEAKSNPKSTIGRSNAQNCNASYRTS